MGHQNKIKPASFSEGDAADARITPATSEEVSSDENDDETDAQRTTLDLPDQKLDASEPDSVSSTTTNDEPLNSSPSRDAPMRVDAADCQCCRVRVEKDRFGNYVPITPEDEGSREVSWTQKRLRRNEANAAH